MDGAKDKLLILNKEKEVDDLHKYFFFCRRTWRFIIKNNNYKV